MDIMRVLATIIFLFLLSFPSPSAGQGSRQLANVIGNFVDMINKFTGNKFLKKAVDMGPDAYDLYKMYMEDNYNSTPSSHSGAGGTNRHLLSPETPSPFMYYYVSLNVGTPPRQVSAVLSITNLFTWVAADASSSFDFLHELQGSSVAASGFCRSLIFSHIINNSVCPSQCASCATNRNSLSYLAIDNFKLDTDTSLLPGKPSLLVYTSDIKDLESPQWVVSLSKSSYSLINQFGYKTFSYYLSSMSESTKLLFLSVNDPIPSLKGRFPQSTTLITNQVYQHLYYVPLSGISVGNRFIPFTTSSPKSDGTGGVVLTTITPFSILESTAYKSLMEELELHGMHPIDLASNIHCFNKPTWPRLTLHIGNANMVLMEKNFVIIEKQTGSECLAMASSPNGLSIIGSMVQLDRHMTFDLANSKLYFDEVPASI